MPLVALAALVLVGAWVWSKPDVRAWIQRDPAKAAFWGLLALSVVLVSFRSGRHWLAVVVAAAIIWGPRIARAVGAARAAGIGTGAPTRDRTDAMSRAEALEVLGLPDGATPEQVMARYRELMKQVHPDRGGSDDLAKRVNRAKSVLVGPS